MAPTHSGGDVASVQRMNLGRAPGGVKFHANGHRAKHTVAYVTVAAIHWGIPLSQIRLRFGSTPLSTKRKLMHTSLIPVRWGDLDAYGHLNNTLYFRFCEQARVEWIEAAGFEVRPERREAPVIINASCTFLVPVNYPANVVVRLFAGEPGRSSVMSWYELYIEGQDQLVAEGASKIVWMDHETGKSVPLPDALRSVIES